MVNECHILINFSCYPSSLSEINSKLILHFKQKLWQNLLQKNSSLTENAPVLLVAQVVHKSDGTFLLITLACVYLFSNCCGCVCSRVCCGCVCCILFDSLGIWYRRTLPLVLFKKYYKRLLNPLSPKI